MQRNHFFIIGKNLNKIPKVPSSAKLPMRFNFWVSRRRLFPQMATLSQSWALSVFLHLFNNKELFFAFIIKLIWLGVTFLNRTGAEIGYQLFKKCKKNHFLLVKILKNIENNKDFHHHFLKTADAVKRPI